MKIHHYSVFAAAPGGGKQFAIVEDVTDHAEMQRIAASSGQPLTGFILNADASSAEVKFFSPTKEKGSSDSGALAVAEHLTRRVLISSASVTIKMGDESLSVYRQGGIWWSQQPDTHVYPLNLNVDELLQATGLSRQQFAYIGEIVSSGTTEKKNIMLPLSQREHMYGLLDAVNPDLDRIADLNRSTRTNGVIVFHYQSEWSELRFFAPGKGIAEDNAGSFTLASLCGFMAGEPEAYIKGLTDLRVSQGVQMGKPSELFANFSAESRAARNIQIGGKVQMIMAGGKE